MIEYFEWLNSSVILVPIPLELKGLPVVVCSLWLHLLLSTGGCHPQRVWRPKISMRLVGLKIAMDPTVPCATPDSTSARSD